MGTGTFSDTSPLTEFGDTSYEGVVAQFPPKCLSLTPTHVIQYSFLLLGELQQSIEWQLILLCLIVDSASFSSPRTGTSYLPLF